MTDILPQLNSRSKIVLENRKKVHAILNPVAGGGFASKSWLDILKILSHFELTYSTTSGPGDAEKIAKKAIDDGNEYIACAGGDGTLNEILQAVAGTETILIPFSAGTGSDFIKNFQVEDSGKIREFVENGISSTVDMGKISMEGKEKFFLNIAEVGFGAMVTTRVNAHKKTRGSASFNAAIFRELLKFTPFNANIDSEDFHKEMKVSEIIIANGKYFGGGIKAAPDALLDDGFFTVHIIHGAGRIRLLKKLGKLRDGTYIHDPMVTTIKVKEIKIAGRALLEADGEDLGHAPATFTVVPHSLRVLGPLK